MIWTAFLGSYQITELVLVVVLHHSVLVSGLLLSAPPASSIGGIWQPETARQRRM